MELETNKPDVSDKDRQMADTKRVNLTPINDDVQPTFDPDRARVYERSGTRATFEFDSETTELPTQIVSDIEKHKAHIRIGLVIIAILVCGLFVISLFTLKNFTR